MKIGQQTGGIVIADDGLQFMRSGDKIGGLTARQDYGLSAPEAVIEPMPLKVVDTDTDVTEIYYTDYKIRMTFTELEDEAGETYITEVIPL